MRAPPVPVVAAVTRVRSAATAVARHLVPPQVGLLDLSLGFASTQLIYVAAKLGVADVLDAHGPLPADEVAARVNADPDALDRLLRACVSLGVFTQRGDARYAHNALSKPLRTTDPMSVRDAVLMVGDPDYWRPWGELEYSVRTGTPSANRVFGMSMWEHAATDNRLNDVLNNAMTSISRMETPAILAAADFTGYRTIVDVGGGHGQLLAAVLAAAPAARGVLFDLETVAPQALSSQVPRLTVATGSFFDAVPSGGDLYLLRRVLHDWDDADAMRILRTVGAAMSPDATLLVIDGVIPPGTGPHFSKVLDLDMLVFVGGRERTEQQWRALLDAAGFRLAEITPTVGPVSLIWARAS